MLDIDRGHEYPAAHHHEPNFRGPNHALFPADFLNFAEIGGRIKICDGDSLIEPSEVGRDESARIQSWRSESLHEFDWFRVIPGYEDSAAATILCGTLIEAFNDDRIERLDDPCAKPFGAAAGRSDLLPATS